MASLAICQRRSVRIALLSGRKATIVPRASMGHAVDMDASSNSRATTGASASAKQSPHAVVTTQALGARTVGPRDAQPSSGLDFADLLHMDERLVHNCLQDAVTYRTLVGCGDELTKRPGQAGSFNVKSASSFRDNVTRNLAPVVVRGLVNHARGKGLKVPAAACSSAFDVQTPEPNSPKCASGGMVEAVILQQQKQFELQQQQLQQLRQQHRDCARGAVWYPGSGVGAAHVMFRQLASAAAAHTAPQQQSVLAASG